MPEGRGWGFQESRTGSRRGEEGRGAGLRDRASGGRTKRMDLALLESVGLAEG